ncbi:TetR/AcrR family transcriptional regulator [Microbacterium sp. NPDC058345]|uniref:TetR/AcrR family transcriptional regulator n=1 Tax=Microbacterium sp. NPDC058345 TaxID=3346455 RepID=UPI003663A5B3
MPDGAAAPRSRRRGQALITAIHAAVLAELDESGYAGMTMERVAERAGAGKASLYRRWNSRAELVRDTAYHLMSDTEGAPDTGSLRGDLRELLRRTVTLLTGPLGGALRAVLSEALADRTRAGEISSLSLGMGRRMMADVVARAVSRGEIDARAITNARLDVGQALLRDRFLFREVTESDVDEIVDTVLVPLLGAPVGAPAHPR